MVVPPGGSLYFQERDYSLTNTYRRNLGGTYLLGNFVDNLLLIFVDKVSLHLVFDEHNITKKHDGACPRQHIDKRKVFEEHLWARKKLYHKCSGKYS